MTLHTSDYATQTPAQVLIAAADLIETTELLKNQYSDGHGYCSVGAIRHVARTSNESIRAIDLLAAHIEAEERLPYDVGYCTVTTWNDFPLRTQEEVVQTMRKAAE
jgi:hypothetical protein